MLEPSSLAETVTPPSFSPDDEVIAPVSSWSAACAPDAMMKPAALASRMLRTCVIVISYGSLGVVKCSVAHFLLAAAGRTGGRRCARHRDGAHIGDDRVDLVLLAIVLEGRHAR